MSMQMAVIWKEQQDAFESDEVVPRAAQVVSYASCEPSPPDQREKPIIGYYSRHWFHCNSVQKPQIEARFHFTLPELAPNALKAHRVGLFCLNKSYSHEWEEAAYWFHLAVSLW